MDSPVHMMVDHDIGVSRRYVALPLTPFDNPRVCTVAIKSE